MKKLLTLVVTLTTLMLVPMTADAGTLTEAQKERAEVIYQTIKANYKEYGCLPSVCLAQAGEESCLGEVCYPNNLWGLWGGSRSYDSLEAGTIAYMEFCNNDYFHSCTFKEDYHDSLAVIAGNGWCQPADGYYSRVLSYLECYNLYEYDERMFRELEEEERIAKEQAEKERVERLNKCKLRELKNAMDKVAKSRKEIEFPELSPVEK